MRKCPKKEHVFIKPDGAGGGKHMFSTEIEQEISTNPAAECGNHWFQMQLE